MRAGLIVLLLAWVLAGGAEAAPKAKPAAAIAKPAIRTSPAPSPLPEGPPPVASLVKPEVLKRALEDREIMSHASLDEIADPMKRYSFYTLMLVRSSLQETRKILTDYKLYAQMVPYIDRAELDPRTNILHLSGGVFGWRMDSWIRFREMGERWIRYDVVNGHFTGLSGDIFFESRGEKGTLAIVRGEQVGNRWPPAFVVERGAEIVFGFTGRKMRSYIEDHKEKIEDDRSTPQPRKHL